MTKHTTDLFKNACRIHTHFAIARYLMANSEGRLDGFEKAQRHIELCKFYVAVARGCSDPDEAAIEYTEDLEKVHEATQELTGYLDERIGFPITGRPDYDKLIPLFFEQFHELAIESLL